MGRIGGMGGPDRQGCWGSDGVTIGTNCQAARFYLPLDKWTLNQRTVAITIRIACV